MNSASSALQCAAAPWLSLLLDARALQFRLTRDGCVDSLVTVAVQVDVGETLVITDCVDPLEHERLRTVREAIDLLYMFLALDPTLLWSTENGVGRQLAADDKIAAKVLERGGDFHLQVTLVVRDLEDSALLERRWHRYLVEHLNDVPSTHAGYVQTRNALVKELNQSNPTWTQPLRTHPIALRYSVSTIGDHDEERDAMEDYVAHIVQFVTTVEAAPSTNSSLDGECHLPLRVDGLTLRIHIMPITDRIVHVWKRLQHVRKGFLTVEHVRVDPRMVECSHALVTEYLIIFRADGGFAVSTGPFRARAIDDDGSDCTQVCTAIIRGVANADHVREIEVGGMMELCTSPASRRGIYRALIEWLFSRSTPIAVAIDSPNAPIGWAVDTIPLREEVAEWRRRHPEGRLTVRELQLGFAEQENTFTAALVDLLDDVEELDIHNYVERPVRLPIATMDAIVTKFVNLRKLYICHVEISSMDLFLQVEHTKLEQLALRDFVLVDRLSFSRFIRAVGNSATEIARSLRKLCIENSGGRSGGFWLETPEVIDEICQALKNNDVLETFVACVQGDEDEMVAMHKRLRETTGQSVRFRLTAKALRAEQARRVAFLSVIQGPSLVSLDASVVKEIFAFGAPAVDRYIKIRWGIRG